MNSLSNVFVNSKFFPYTEPAYAVQTFLLGIFFSASRRGKMNNNKGTVPFIQLYFPVDTFLILIQVSSTNKQSPNKPLQPSEGSLQSLLHSSWPQFSLLEFLSFQHHYCQKFRLQQLFLFPYHPSVFGLISSLSSRPVLLISQIQALNFPFPHKMIFYFHQSSISFNNDNYPYSSIFLKAFLLETKDYIYL